MKKNLKLILLVIPVIIFSKQAFCCRCGNPFPKIDSLAQLDRYAFIALVKITGDTVYKEATSEQPDAIGKLTFTIIELFRGQPVKTVLERSINSSCNMGTGIGEEWVLFATLQNGQLFIGPCDRNRRYKTNDRVRDWEYGRGFYELSRLRKLYSHPVKQWLNEKRVEYYPNGQKEIEETYVNGKLQGARKIWYSNGVLYGRETYINDSIDGKSEWFYPSGQVSKEDYYVRGKPCNVWRRYSKNDAPSALRQQELHPWLEYAHDSYGRIIISRQYYQSGKIQREETTNPDSNTSVIIFYHNNGNISDIMYYRNNNAYGHYQRYNKEGYPSRGWDYDENGRQVNQN